LQGLVHQHPYISALLAAAAIKILPMMAAALAGGGSGFLTGLTLMLVTVMFLRRMGWAAIVGFNGPAKWQEAWLAWLPFVYVGLPFINMAWRELTPDIGAPLLARLVALGAAQGLAVAFVEETTFRGLVLAILLYRFQRVHVTRDATLQVRNSLLFSGVLFGLWHLPVALTNPHWTTAAAQLIYPVFAGVGYAGVVLRTGSIWLTVAAHALLIVSNVVVAGITIDPGPPANSSLIWISAATSVLLLVPWLFYGLYLTRDITRLTITRFAVVDRPATSLL
jgi:membrane protease YdiL (CAAX protease family)